MRRICLLAIMAFCAGACFFTSGGIAPGENGTAEPPRYRPPLEAPPLRQPDAGMLRYPDISATHIVFVYANDLWVAPREGGTASPLASPPGQELYPKFSPDGRRIAFVGNYDGNPDLYTVPLSGGLPHRVTHHPAAESLCDWTPGGELLFYTNGLAPLQRQTQLMIVPASGGLPRQCPLPYGANGAISPDGRFLAYTPHTIDHRTWKRYRGGMATDIWLMELQTRQARKATDWEGTDTLPMWHGGTMYYLSDAGPEHRLNIWSLDPASGQRRQITRFSEYDVKWPSMGPGPQGQGEIVFQYGPTLAAVDLKSLDQRIISIRVPGARPTLRPKEIDMSRYMASWNISPTGRRAVVEARGDIWTLPASKGIPHNLTRTSGAAERDPAWSPDGKWVAYFSDATGEYELYITQSDGAGPTQQLTSGSQTYYYHPTWSPDSKQIAFSDKAGTIHVHSLEKKQTKKIDTDALARNHRVAWSPNSKWLAYVKHGGNRVSAVWLHELEAGKSHQVTGGMFNDSWPVFSRDEKFLFFASNRRFTSPVYDDVGDGFVYKNTDILLAVPLKVGTPLPWQPTNDEENFPGRPMEAPPAITSKNYIDLAGFERRAFALPGVAPGAFSYLESVGPSTLVYVRGASRGEEGGPPPSIKFYDLRTRSESTLLSNASAVRASANGAKLLVRQGAGLGLLNPVAGATPQAPAAVPTSGMTAPVDPRQEWRQLFTDAWRIQRDFFYDPHMHGVDWSAVRERYLRMLDDCTSREDVSFVIGEMISELNVGHTYVRGHGDVEGAPSVDVGMLGCDYELHDDGQGHRAYRISKVYEGAPWDYDARGPLSQPGVKVGAGDYLLAVNGTPVATSKDPWAAFIGLAGKVTKLTVSTKPERDAAARDVLVVPMQSEASLRYRAWIEKNRAYVEQKTGGQVGYMYVPDTGIPGQNELFRQFYGQIDKPGLIVDERWNGGGQIPTRFIELLNRPVTNYWARRDGLDWTWPRDAHPGKKCMLINGMAGSGGDAFPHYFRQAGLGKLIGTRTWGGLVGISGNPTLIDGGSVSAPTFAFYEKNGTWGIEGHGVEPDKGFEVVDDPTLMQNGGDPQLDAAISHLQDELKKSPYVPPKRPPYPDRSKFGIKEEDK
jgi:tricorn protease